MTEELIINGLSITPAQRGGEPKGGRNLCGNNATLTGSLTEITVIESVTKPILIQLPIEPLWTYEQVAVLMSTSVNALRRLINRNKAFLGEPIYITQGKRKRRVLSSPEIKMLQGKRLKGLGVARYLASCKG